MLEFAFLCAFALVGVFSWRASEHKRKLKIVTNVVALNIPEKKWTAWVKRYYEEWL